jgi:hypothetical protein
MIYIILIILLLLLLLLNKKSEGNANVSASETAPLEAIQNLASMYNNKKLIATNIDMTGNINLNADGDKYKSSSIVSSGTLIMHGLQDAHVNPKGTTYISKGWGGTGNFVVQGNAWVEGNTELKGDVIINKGLDAKGESKLNFGRRHASDQNASDIDVDSGGGEKSIFCPENQYVCGVKTKHWLHGRGRMNDSGILGLQLKCCSFN